MRDGGGEPDKAIASAKREVRREPVNPGGRNKAITATDILRPHVTWVGASYMTAREAAAKVPEQVGGGPAKPAKALWLFCHL